MSSKYIGAVVFGISACAFTTSSVIAADAYFAGAEQSIVSYTATPHRSLRSCETLQDLGSDAVSVKVTLVAATEDAPEHCEVIAIVSPDTHVYIGLPTAWNGRLWMIGNGGFAGGSVLRQKVIEGDIIAAVRYRAVNAGLQHGFMTVYTNGGHSRGGPFDADFAYQRPDLLDDWIEGAVHKGVDLAKTAAQTFYDQRPQYSYFDACSNGGRQGLRAATEYPEDFDGIVSNAPALRWSEIVLKVLWNDAAFRRAPTLTSQKLTIAWQHVLYKCDATDGVMDGLIGDPRVCNFDPETDLPKCSEEQDKECFNAADIQSLKDIYKGPPLRDGTTSPQYWDTLHPATVYGWLANGDGSPLIGTFLAQSFLRYMAFYPDQNPSYDWKEFDFERDLPRLQKIDEMLNTTTDLGAFQNAGGKIIGYWGWSDAGLNAQTGTEYYDQVADPFGLEKTLDFYRMFFIPGVAHCAAGYGPGEIDMMTPLIEWVEAGKTPGRLKARKTVDDQVKYDRAYCPYPQRTVYQGGDPEQHASWTCMDR